MLCRNGAAGGRNLVVAVFAYNHDRSYVLRVLQLARTYPAPPPINAVFWADVLRHAPNRAAQTALSYAFRQLGVPYVWGGEGPQTKRLSSGATSISGGFDCSGLVQAAYAAAGIRLPRTATEQYHAGVRVPSSQPLEPGDLVFYGGTSFLHHVGIAISPTEMIDAPHTGAFVRFDPIRYHGDDYFGAVRLTMSVPAGSN